MNLWGFTPDYFDYTGREFARFLAAHGCEAKSEFGIPTVVDALLASGEATVKVLDTDSRWFGVTYAADRQAWWSVWPTCTAEGNILRPCLADRNI